MSSMKFLHGLCIFYIVSLFCCPSVFAQSKACTFFDSKIEGVEVGQMSDRKIYTLFTTHLGNEDNEIMENIFSHEPEDAVGLLNQLIEKYQATIVSEQSDA